MSIVRDGSTKRANKQRKYRHRELDTVEIYNIARSEIISNHVLMHWFSIIVVVTILAGVLVVEIRGRTILSVFLPLLAVAWAAAMVRFDFFIHRQAAYLRQLEAQMREAGVTVPLWETWKASLRSTVIVVPAADVLASAVIVVPTLYLLFGPAQQFFLQRGWRWGKLYAWTISAILLILLASLVVIPKIADYR
jgi:hypothetical protein